MRKADVKGHWRTRKGRTEWVQSHGRKSAYPVYFAIAKLVKRFKESSDAQKSQMYVMLA